jgi:ribosome-associated protein
MEEDDFISKTQRKRRMSELQDVGAELVKLSREQIRRLDLPETLREAVLECQGITRHEARRRQMQYIGRIMRDLDAAPIVAQLASLQAPSRKDTALFHLAEKWRDEMVADPQAIERFAHEFPSADAHRLGALVAAARAERAAQRTPKNFRLLFHAVNTIVQDHARSR